MLCDPLLLFIKHINVSFSWVCPVIDDEFCHNFVEVVRRSTPLSACGSLFSSDISRVIHWIATTATTTTKVMMTISQMNSREAATTKRTKATKANWTRCWPHFEHVLDHCRKNDPVESHQSSGTSTKSLLSRSFLSPSLKERIAKRFLASKPVAIKFANHSVDLHSMWNEYTVLKAPKVSSWIVSSRLSMIFLIETRIKRSLSVLVGDESLCVITLFFPTSIWNSLEYNILEIHLDYPLLCNWCAQSQYENLPLWRHFLTTNQPFLRSVG